jgi:hypothetical protein
MVHQDEYGKKEKRKEKSKYSIFNLQVLLIGFLITISIYCNSTVDQQESTIPILQ